MSRGLDASNVSAVDDVVVRPAVQSGDGVPLFDPRGEHEDRYVRGPLALAQVAADFHAVHPGEVEVEQDQVGHLLAYRLQAFFAVSGDQPFGFDPNALEYIASEILAVHARGVQVGVVIGGGNIFRGLQASHLGMDRANGDYMGMLATVINGMALQDCLEKIEVPTRVMSAIHVQEVAEPYIRRRAIRHLEKGRIVILAGGTGNPHFTTDTAASLRAAEIGAEIILKATKVDGVYTADPMKDASAKLLKEISHKEVLTRGLRVMDATAISLCMENDLPIIVFKMGERDALKRILIGEDVGTLVGSSLG